MGIRTLLYFLIGSPTAIRQVAASKQALWLGLVFVLSAGLAREYDGQDLVHEPWHLLIPLGASLISSFVLFLLCFAKVIASDPARPPFLAAYRSFLTVFWMTAPLAWLYAIPYERFLSPYGAMQANLLTLAAVAVWRVALMVRVVTTLMGYGTLAALSLVMLFGDGVALFAISFVPKPIIAIMGGIQLTPIEGLILTTTCCVAQLGGLTLPVWGGVVLSTLSKCKPRWLLPLSTDKSPTRLHAGLVIVALFSIGVWIPILPLTQAEQLNRSRAEHALRAGRIAEALADMSAHVPSDYPPSWEPPPRIGYGESSPFILDVIDVVVENPPAPWVREVFLEKLDRFLDDYYGLPSSQRVELETLLRLLQRLPEGKSLFLKHRTHLERVYGDPGKLTTEARKFLGPLPDAKREE
jgi:hypothetical protein